jgi:hypothetical protein
MGMGCGRWPLDLWKPSGRLAGPPIVEGQHCQAAPLLFVIPVIRVGEHVLSLTSTGG